MQRDPRMMKGSSSTTGQLGYEPGTRGVDPVAAARARIQDSIGVALPEALSARLYYIRGVANSKYLGGDDRDVVAFPGEFLYVMDVGYPALAAISVPFTIDGAGAPHFPDFSEGTARAVQSWERRDLVFPLVPGKLIVGAEEGLGLPEVTDRLSQYASEVTVLTASANLYLASVHPFHEKAVANEINHEHLSGIRYVEVDQVVRLIDFAPGWLVDRVF